MRYEQLRKLLPQNCFLAPKSPSRKNIASGYVIAQYFKSLYSVELTYQVHIDSWRTGKFWVHAGTVAGSPTRRREHGWDTSGDQSSGGQQGTEHPPGSQDDPCPAIEMIHVELRVQLGMTMSRWDDPCPAQRIDPVTYGRKVHAPSGQPHRRRTPREISRRDRIHQHSTLLQHTNMTTNPSGSLSYNSV